ncbi:hypothetical protein HD554DRAFT_2081344, partial [Boletus coccyginus]
TRLFIIYMFAILTSPYKALREGPQTRGGRTTLSERVSWVCSCLAQRMEGDNRDRALSFDAMSNQAPRCRSAINRVSESGDESESDGGSFQREDAVCGPHTLRTTLTVPRPQADMVQSPSMLPMPSSGCCDYPSTR